ncbi:CvfB family protein [Lacticaseibacillus hulanensis]|uniref:CvfB family protein n=1 Tax=Lacticaseibacillus hulanensis TaxID=2493111 RepID=UPI000FDC2934|nr:S1-like domain-containing RNA-binding protein [Lacticaseibacillus hulanensis]
MEFNGQFITGKVSDKNDTTVFVQYAGVTMPVDATEFGEDVPEIGADVTGFAYEDEHHHPRLTTKQPKISESQYAYCDVVATRRDLGVFVDAGLPDKDIAVSLDELPLETYLWPQRGDRLMVKLIIDKKDRMWATIAGGDIISQLSRRAHADMMNKDVTATVYRNKIVGTFVFTDEHQLGFIHPSERDVEPRLGQVVHGRVIGVRDDGGLNISLKPRAFEAIDDDAGMVLAVLEHSRDGRLELTDKSSPDEINRQLDISKGAFKRAVGHLLKARKITIHDGYIELVAKKD